MVRMRSQTAIKQLERRVDRLEESLASVRRSPADELARARSLLYDDLRAGRTVDPIPFAVRHDLRLEVVERAIEEFTQKGWAVEIDDETP